MTRRLRLRRERGLLLLPVVLTLTIVGALAYAMTREGSMDVSGVDARYDTEVARYLAESGLNLVKWQNEKRDCNSHVGFGTLALPGGTVVTGAVTTKGKNTLNVSLVASTGRGAVRTLDTVSVNTFDLTNVTETTLGGPGGNDTTITLGTTTSQSNSAYLSVSDGKSHGILKFSTGGPLDNVAVVSATLSLTQVDSNSTQSPRSLAVHRVTTDWPSGATWTTPWTTPGGDIDAAPVAAVGIAGNATYNWRIDALVQGWVDKTLANQGLLLKPSGLLDARFASLDASSNQPKLVVRYFPRCS